MSKETSENRRKQIAEAALKVISESGLSRFTTAEIAKEVGVTDGAMFRHFANKEEIVLAAIDRAEEILFEDLPTDPDPIARLRAFFFQRVSHLKKTAGITRILFSDELSHAAGPKGAQRVAEIKMRSIMFIRGCLQEAVSEGRVRNGAIIEDFMMIVQGTALAFTFMARREKDQSVDPEKISRVWTMLEKLLKD